MRMVNEGQFFGQKALRSSCSDAFSTEGANPLSFRESASLIETLSQREGTSPRRSGATTTRRTDEEAADLLASHAA